VVCLVNHFILLNFMAIDVYLGVLSLLRARVILRLVFWLSVMLAGFELNRRSEDISWGMDIVVTNVKDFIERRLTTPTVRYFTINKSRLLLHILLYSSQHFE